MPILGIRNYSCFLLLSLLSVLQTKPQARAEDAVDVAIQQLGDPYVDAQAGPDSFDCSGLMQYVYKQVGIQLPKFSGDQAQVGPHFKGPLRRGDLLFFDTKPIFTNKVSHVGIYESNNVMIHARDERYGVLRQDISTSWWQERFLFAVRIDTCTPIFTPDLLTFPDTPTESCSLPSVITIQNPLNCSRSLMATARVDDPFVLVYGASVNLMPGTSQDVGISFCPDSVDTYNKTLILETTTSTFSSNLRGTSTPTIPALTFGATAEGSFTESDSNDPVFMPDLKTDTYRFQGEVGDIIDIVVEADFDQPTISLLRVPGGTLEPFPYLLAVSSCYPLERTTCIRDLVVSEVTDNTPPPHYIYLKVAGPVGGHYKVHLNHGPICTFVLLPESLIFDTVSTPGTCTKRTLTLATPLGCLEQHALEVVLPGRSVFMYDARAGIFTYKDHDYAEADFLFCPTIPGEYSYTANVVRWDYNTESFFQTLPFLGTMLP